MEHITIHRRVHPTGEPVLVDTRWYQCRGRAYVYPIDDGFVCYSADDGAFLCWSSSIANAPTDASLAEMIRWKGADALARALLT